MSCITLLSDFGLEDAATAATKGILMQHNPQLPIVDISHRVAPHQVMQAAYLLLSAYKNFPEGSCHIVLVNVLYDKAPRMVYCEVDHHYFIAPDNGLLPLAFSGLTDGYTCFQWSNASTFKDWLHEAGKLVAHLQTGTQDAAYTPCTIHKATDSFAPHITPDGAECRIIYIDHYENVIVNITRQQFEDAARGRHFRIEYMRNEVITTLNNNYSDVKAGDKLCRFNSAGFLEIAINKGNAASLFGLKVYQEQHLIYNHVKIFFE